MVRAALERTSLVVSLLRVCVRAHKVITPQTGDVVVVSDDEQTPHYTHRWRRRRSDADPVCGIITCKRHFDGARVALLCATCNA